MTPADFKRIALSFDGAEEGSHMGAVDFRVGDRIFATLASVAKGYGNVMLSPEQQRDFVAELPEVFIPVVGKWGEAGVTHIRLAGANEDLVRGALHAAWKRRLELNANTRSSRVQKRVPGRKA
jgi:YjbR